jgi:hypothetical protein
MPASPAPTTPTPQPKLVRVVTRRDQFNARYQIFGPVVFDSLMRVLQAGRMRIQVWVDYEQKRHALIMVWVNNMLTNTP